MKHKDKNNVVFTAIIGGIIGAAIAFILKMLFLNFIYEKPNTYGNVADWVSGLGSILAIVFIYIQIRQDKIRYDDSHRPQLEIHSSKRKMINKKNNIITVTSVDELAIYGTNTGKVPGFYKYMGMCDLKDYDDAISSGEDIDDLKKNLKLKDLEPKYDIGAAERPFEKIEPFGMTSVVSFPIKTIRQNFPSRDMHLCIVFVNASLNPIKKSFKFDF